MLSILYRIAILSTELLSGEAANSLMPGEL